MYFQLQRQAGARDGPQVCFTVQDEIALQDGQALGQPDNGVIALLEALDQQRGLIQVGLPKPGFVGWGLLDGLLEQWIHAQGAVVWHGNFDHQGGICLVGEA